MRLEALDLWLDCPGTGPLLPQLRQELSRRIVDHAQPLRWAITAAETTPQGGRRLRIEAVLLHPQG